MQDDKVSTALVAMMSVQLRGVTLDTGRADELALDLRRLLNAGRSAGMSNGFNDQPSEFLAVLEQLAVDRPEPA
jgi:hypothetical protein